MSSTAGCFVIIPAPWSTAVILTSTLFSRRTAPVLFCRMCCYPLLPRTRANLRRRKQNVSQWHLRPKANVAHWHLWPKPKMAHWHPRRPKPNRCLCTRRKCRRRRRHRRSSSSSSSKHRPQHPHHRMRHPTPPSRRRHRRSSSSSSKHRPHHPHHRMRHPTPPSL